MTTRNDFVKKAVAAGLTNEQIKSAMNDRRKKIGAFDDDVVKNKVPEPVKEEPKKGFLEPIMTSKLAPTFGYSIDQKYGDENIDKGELAQAMFPRVSKNADKGIVIGSLSGALDAASLPGRILSTAYNAEGKNDQETLRELSKTSVDDKPISIGSFLEGVARDPVTPFTLGAGGIAKNAVATLGKKGLKEVLKKSALQGLKGGIEGVASAVVHQTDNGLQDKGINSKEALAEVAISSLLPFVFKLGGAGVKKVVSKTGDFTKGVASELSGVSKQAYDAWTDKVGKQNIIDVAGKQGEIGVELIDKLRNFEDVLPEYKEVNKALEDMGKQGKRFSKQDLLDDITSFKSNIELVPQEIRQNEGLDKLSNRIDETFKTPQSALDKQKQALMKSVMGKFFDSGNLDKILNSDNLLAKDTKKFTRLSYDEIINHMINNMGTRKLTPIEYKQIIKSLDSELDSAYGKDSNSQFTIALKKIRHSMSEKLKAASKGTEYEPLMEDYAEKLKVRDNLLYSLGQRIDVQDSRVNSFVDRLFAPSNEHKADLVKGLDDFFKGKGIQSDIYTKAQNARYAKELGIDAGDKAPDWMPRQTTGRSSLGLNMGTAIGTAAGALGLPFGMDLVGVLGGTAIGRAAGAFASSPRIVAGAYQAAKEATKATKKVGDLIKKAKLNPDQLVKYSRGTVADFLTKDKEDKK